MSEIRTKVATVAAICGAAVGGGAIANAATSSSSPSTTAPSAQAPSGPPPQGGMVNGRHSVGGKTEAPLSGTTAAKVKAAALDKVSGTVERVETNVDSSAPYEAHVQKSDGSEVTVEVGSDFSVASVQSMPGRP
jgi:hypothetical protein